MTGNDQIQPKCSSFFIVIECKPLASTKCPWVPQAVLRVSGVRLMRELLAWASSVMETRPLCLMNWATESSSAGVMEMNFPRSSITPGKEKQQQGGQR